MKNVLWIQLCALCLKEGRKRVLSLNGLPGQNVMCPLN